MCLIEAVPATQEAGLITPSQLDLGLSLQNPCPFGAQVFAPGGGFGGSEVARCRLQVASLSSEHSQHAIHQKPVELSLEREKAAIALCCELTLIEGYSTECLAGSDGPNRQHLFWQEGQHAFLLKQGGSRLIAFAERCLNQAKEPDIKHESSWTTLRVDQSRLTLVLGHLVILLLIGKKGLHLVQEGEGHRIGELVDDGVCLPYHLLCLHPFPLRGGEEHQPGIGGTQGIGLLAALRVRDLPPAHLSGTPDVCQPVGRQRQIEATFCRLYAIIPRFDHPQGVLQVCHRRGEVTDRHTEVGSNGPFCYRLKVNITERLRHLKRSLSIARPLNLLSQVDR